MKRVQQVLAACGRKINTAFVERLNLDIRQRVAAVGRRVNTAVPGRGRLTPAAGGVPCVLQFLPASCEFTPAPVGS
jgi:hypothetical protein